MTDTTYAAISSISTAITAFISMTALFIALRAARSANESAKTGRCVDVHSRFQNEIRAIQRSLPWHVNDPNWQPTPEQTRTIALYWYLVFDEWFTCTRLGSDLRPLWEKHYSEAVKAALRLPQFKLSIEGIFRGSMSFFGYGNEFRVEIERLCREATGRKLIP